MPAGLNAFPPGLLSFFGIKNGGRNPEDLGTILAPTLELRDWYLAQQWQRVQLSSGNVNAIGFFGITSVPPAEWWMIRFLTARPLAALGAATTWTFSLAHQLDNTTQPVSLGPPVTGTVGGMPMASYPDVLIIRPSGALGVFCQAFAGVAQQCAVAFDRVILTA